VGVRARRLIATAAILAAVTTLTGCTHPVEDATEQLATELRHYDFVEYVLVSSDENTVFGEGFSAISVDVFFDTTADDLDDLITYWRFGVDGIDGRWIFRISRPGGEHTGMGYDDFSVSGVRSVADLTEMVRFWHDLGERTESAGVGIDDYSDTQDGFIQLEFPAQPTNSLHEIIGSLAEDATELPGRFQWSVDAPIPAGLVTLAGVNLLPDTHMLDLLEAVVTAPADSQAQPLTVWASETIRDFGPVREPRLYISVDLPELDLARIHYMADHLPHDERYVVLEFSVAGDTVAQLDPYQCLTPGSVDVYGPLTYDLWQYWLRDGASTPQGFTAESCDSHR
jgi:hypothetical protein